MRIQAVTQQILCSQRKTAPPRNTGEVSSVLKIIPSFGQTPEVDECIYNDIEKFTCKLYN